MDSERLWRYMLMSKFSVLPHPLQLSICLPYFITTQHEAGMIFQKHLPTLLTWLLTTKYLMKFSTSWHPNLQWDWNVSIRRWSKCFTGITVYTTTINYSPPNSNPWWKTSACTDCRKHWRSTWSMQNTSLLLVPKPCGLDGGEIRARTLPELA